MCAQAMRLARVKWYSTFHKLKSNAHVLHLGVPRAEHDSFLNNATCPQLCSQWREQHRQHDQQLQQDPQHKQHQHQHHRQHQHQQQQHNHQHQQQQQQQQQQRHHQYQQQQQLQLLLQHQNSQIRGAFLNSHHRRGTKFKTNITLSPWTAWAQTQSCQRRYLRSGTPLFSKKGQDSPTNIGHQRATKAYVKDIHVEATPTATKIPHIYTDADRDAFVNANVDKDKHKHKDKDKENDAESQQNRLHARPLPLASSIGPPASANLSPEQLTKRTAALEKMLTSLSEKLDDQSVRLDLNDEMTRRLWHPESVEKIHSQLLSMDSILQSSSQAINQWTGRELVSPTVIVVLCVVFVLYMLFRDIIRKWLGTEVAAVTATTMSDEELLRTVKNAVTTIAESPEAIESCTRLVNAVMARQDTRVALREMFNWLMQDKYFQDVGVYYMMQVMTDPAMEEYMSEQMSALVEATVTDPTVQQKSGQGAWEAFKYGFTPALLTSDFWTNQTWGRRWGFAVNVEDEDQSAEVSLQQQQLQQQQRQLQPTTMPDVSAPYDDEYFEERAPYSLW